MYSIKISTYALGISRELFATRWKFSSKKLIKSSSLFQNILYTYLHHWAFFLRRWICRWSNSMWTIPVWYATLVIVPKIMVGMLTGPWYWRWSEQPTAWPACLYYYIHHSSLQPSTKCTPHHNPVRTQESRGSSAAKNYNPYPPDNEQIPQIQWCVRELIRPYVEQKRRKYTTNHTVRQTRRTHTGWNWFFSWTWWNPDSQSRFPARCVHWFVDPKQEVKNLLQWSTWLLILGAG